jgi:cytoplasmic iron level regulating protein YaaA (DUF328/UPF0246 family)
MMILLHSSKTMRPVSDPVDEPRSPLLLDQAKELDAYLKTLTPDQLARMMSLSPELAEKTYALIAGWTPDPQKQALAIDCFSGDIYSGLQVNEFSAEDRSYADQVLYILSGLYGLIRSLDGICPYRLEMGYKLPGFKVNNLYAFWRERIAACLPQGEWMVNLAAAEYAQVVTKYFPADCLVTPKFLTVSPKTGRPEFVVVHAKIARGAFARWLITGRVQERAALTQFAALGYRFVEELSTPESPTFVCETFGGKGLSVRLR